MDESTSGTELETPGQDASSFLKVQITEEKEAEETASKKRRCVRPPKKFNDYIDINREDSIKPLISSIMQASKKDKHKKPKLEKTAKKDVWLLDLLPCSTYEYSRDSKAHSSAHHETATINNFRKEAEEMSMIEEPPDSKPPKSSEEDIRFLENKNNIDLLQASSQFLGEHFMSFSGPQQPVKKPTPKRSYTSRSKKPKPVTLEGKSRGKPGMGRALHFCFHCTYNSKSKAHLRTHIESVHLLLKRFSCNLCSYKGTQQCHLRQHIKAVHNKDRPFACTLCDYKATQKGHLKLHIDTVHEKSKPFGCNFCNFRSSLRCVVTKHVNDIHLKLKRYSCDLCQFKTTRLRNLKTHISSAHSDKSSQVINSFPKLVLNQNFTCDHCPFQTSYKHSLNTHVKSVHKNIKNFKCEQCAYATSYRSSLNNHVKAIHLGLKPYSCKICGYQASLRYTIKTHMENVHKQVKKFSCDLCGYSVSLKHYLIKHIHTQHKDSV